MMVTDPVLAAVCITVATLVSVMYFGHYSPDEVGLKYYEDCFVSLRTSRDHMLALEDKFVPAISEAMLKCFRRKEVCCAAKELVYTAIRQQCPSFQGCNENTCAYYSPRDNPDYVMNTCSYWRLLNEIAREPPKTTSKTVYATSFINGPTFY